MTIRAAAVASAVDSAADSAVVSAEDTAEAGRMDYVTPDCM